MDLFKERFTPEERMEEWGHQHIYHLSGSGIIGRPLTSHLSGTKTFLRENSKVDLIVCCDGLEVIKAAKTRANDANREVLRAVSLKNDANVKLPGFQELTSMVYEMAFQNVDDWGWHPHHQKGIAIAQLLQTLTGMHVSNSVRDSRTDHHLKLGDVIIKFERPCQDGEAQTSNLELTCGDEKNSNFEPPNVHSLEVRELIGTVKVEYKRRHIGRVDELSDCVCLALAYWAKSSGARTNEPFFTMRRISQKTNKVTVCFTNSSHVKFVITYTAVALALGSPTTRHTLPVQVS